MRILQVMAGNSHGGAETAFVDTCIAMHQAGHDIEIVSRPNDVRIKAIEAAGIPVHLLPFGGKIDIFTPWKMKKIIRHFKPDIIQTWMARGSDKTPAWNASMGIPRYHVVARLGGYYKMKYFKSCDYFITITPDIKTYLEKQGVPAQNVRVIHNFAETETVKTPINRANYGTPEDATLLLGLGRLHPAKAFDTLIKACAEMPDVHCWIAGEGPQRQELEALIQSLNVQDRVKLLGWRTDRAALLQAADICTFCSRFEPFGTVFVQAWAQETPVIVTKADGPRQFVRNGHDALLIEIDDIPALKEAVEKIRENKQLAAQLITNGRKRYEEEFTKEKTCAAYENYYTYITENKNSDKAA